VKGSVEGLALNNPVHYWPIDPATKYQYAAGLRTNYKMLYVDRAFDPSGLIRALEVSFDLRTFLLQIEILC
jgi:hypothetical protein